MMDNPLSDQAIAVRRRFSILFSIRQTCGPRLRFTWLLLLVLVLLAGCGRNRNQPAVQPEARAMVPTFTATPVAPASRAEDTVQSLAPLSASNQAAPGTDTPTPAPPPTATHTPTPTATPQPHVRLQDAHRLHRYGFYADEQAVLLALLDDSGASSEQILDARYRLAESYLAVDDYAQSLAMLDQFRLEASAQNESDPRLVSALVVRADALVGLGRYDEAIADYETFLESHPALAEVIQEDIAMAYRAAGDWTNAAQAYGRAIEASPDRVAGVRLREALADVLKNAGRYQEAAAVYDEILANSRNADYRVTVQHRAGLAYAQAGDEATAIQRWQAALDEAPDSESAYQSLIQLVNRNVPVDLYVRGYVDLQAEAYVPAINAFQQFLASASPDDPRRGEALLGLGQSHLGQGAFAAALVALDQVIGQYPDCSCFGQAWLDKAQTQIARGDSVAGRRIYRTFAREYADDALAPEALWRSALSAIGDDSEIEAASDFLALVDRFPTSEQAPNALYVLGIGSMVNELYAQASDSFGRLRTDYPDQRWPAATYWLGRALYAQGQTEQAQEQWRTLVEQEPDTYYGVLAAQALHAPGNLGRDILVGLDSLAGPLSTLAEDNGSQTFAQEWLAAWLDVPAADLATLPPAVAADPDLQSGRLLLDLNRRGAALTLLDRVYSRYQENPRALYALGLLFEELGTYRLSINSIAQLLVFSPARLVEDAPLFLQRMLYPRHFSQLIEAEARANGLDPLLLYSLVRQESLFEEGARSYAAAQGLTQVIPTTGEWIANQLGFASYTNAMIYRPHINVRFGAYYLGWTRNFLDGNLTSALAGYNAGPGNAKRWRERSGPDDTLFVELLTLSEPRIYVQKILANLYQYHRLYPGG